MVNFTSKTYQMKRDILTFIINSKTEIENIVLKYYQNKINKETIRTFLDVYWHWRSVQDTLVSDNTIVKYNTDCERYFQNTDFSIKDIAKITIEDVKVFISTTVKRLKLCQKACKTLFSYIRNTFESAKINNWIVINPMDTLTAKQFYPLCNKKTKNANTETISDLDRQALLNRFYKD